jgi:hypothetical protein
VEAQSQEGKRLSTLALGSSDLSEKLQMVSLLPFHLELFKYEGLKNVCFLVLDSCG